ncbi:DcrB-related protein [Pseudomonas monteilii]
MDYQMHEGSITLPAGFQDRTVNMFTYGHTLPTALSISVTRDAMLSGEDLDAYVARQIKLIAAQLRGYTIVDQSPVVFSSTQPLTGIQIKAHYLKDGKPIHQRQAAVEVGPQRILVFSTTSQSPFNVDQDESWQSLLSSFVPRQAVSPEHPTQG